MVALLGLALVEGVVAAALCCKATETEWTHPSDEGVSMCQSFEFGAADDLILLEVAGMGAAVFVGDAAVGLVRTCDDVAVHLVSYVDRLDCA